MATDYNAFRSSGNAFLDSHYNARGLVTAGLIAPLGEGPTPNSFKPIYHASVGQPYATIIRKNSGEIGNFSFPQRFEYIGVLPVLSVPASWEADNLPPGLTLLDENPSDNIIRVTGTPTTAGDFTFRLRADSESGFTQEGTFTMLVRAQVDWSNVDEVQVPNITTPIPDLTSDGVMSFQGNYNWLVFGPYDQFGLWFGQVFDPAGANYPDPDGYIEAGGTGLSFSPDGSIGYSWTQTSGTTDPPTGSYTNGSGGTTPPDPALIVLA